LLLWYLLAIVLFVLLWYTDSDCPFGIFWPLCCLWPKDTKGAIRICISKKNRQHNGQKKMYKRTNNDLQNIHVKLKIE
jgi:hypothetical protein